MKSLILIKRFWKCFCRVRNWISGKEQSVDIRFCFEDQTLERTLGRNPSQQQIDGEASLSHGVRLEGPQLARSVLPFVRSGVTPISPGEPAASNLNHISRVPFNFRTHTNIYSGVYTFNIPLSIFPNILSLNLYNIKIHFSSNAINFDLILSTSYVFLFF